MDPRRTNLMPAHPEKGNYYVGFNALCCFMLAQGYCKSMVTFFRDALNNQAHVNGAKIIGEHFPKMFFVSGASAKKSQARARVYDEKRR